MFRWSCALRNKGKRCYRRFNYVGRLCEGCTHYIDEKIHYQPTIILSGAAFEAFERERQDFDEWMNKHENRDLDILCEVSSIKPRFKKTMSSGKGQLRLDGYLLVMRHGYIGITECDDYFYANISPNQQDRCRFAVGDKFEAMGRMSLNRGRLLFHKIWSVVFVHRSNKPTWNNSKALVARTSAAEFSMQPEACIRCPHGVLVDTVIFMDGQKQFKRSLYCLEGIKSPELCYLSENDKMDLCILHQNEIKDT